MQATSRCSAPHRAEGKVEQHCLPSGSCRRSGSMPSITAPRSTGKRSSQSETGEVRLPVAQDSNREVGERPPSTGVPGYRTSEYRLIQAAVTERKCLHLAKLAVESVI